MEQWTMNRIGLVDFWYYDDQEFSFINGRMLLRGSNGSGKSVTMQSVIPLLLDGNMRPERLDPFGSRDRKMSSYLLEEGDGREERIGYLYLEFLKPEKNLYHTIGMGLRARRGKPMESWYFYISDGRRINRDFYLYKEIDGKITLTQKELMNRIGIGGRVFSSQMEYMEHVNRQFFGFETVDEYKEMIDLLIQLRTPKLSKDFKPSVINEILSDSLQPLSEEDLRPMSEAIENMDNLSTSLKNKEMSVQALEKINRQYEKYNGFILNEKTKLYLENETAKRSLDQKIEQVKKDLEVQLKEQDHLKEQKNKLEQEKTVREQEKENLNASDAVSLKQREADVSARLAQSRNSLQEKEKQLQQKQEKWKENEIRYKEALTKTELIKEEIDETLDEMREYVTVVFENEHTFFETEFSDNIDREFSYETHLSQLKKLEEKLKTGKNILEKMEDEKKEREKQLKNYDCEKDKRTTLERSIASAETEIAEMLEAKKEELYQWNSQNTELKVSKEKMQEINRFFENFDLASDYHEIKNIVSQSYFEIKNQLEKEKNQIEIRKTAKEEEIQNLERELKDWENQKDPEPEISDAVKRSRENLTRKNIPYHRFYETMEFEPGMDENQKNHLEEALLLMGILDALLVDESYKEQVLSLDPGNCDKYIFTDGAYFEKNLSNLIAVGEDYNDIFINQKVMSALGGIGTAKNDKTYILEDGTYGIGVLHGTITGEYQSKYIGKSSRIRFREEQIAKIKKALEEQKISLEEICAEITALKKRTELLDQEFKAIPEGKILHEKMQALVDAKGHLEHQINVMKELEEQLKVQADKIRKLLEEASEIAEDIYIACKLEEFQRAVDDMSEYKEHLTDLRANHAKYLQNCSEKMHANEQMESLDADMDDIRYEASQIKQRANKETLELSSIQEQLALTNYEEIKEKLSTCMERLLRIPEEVEKCIKGISDCEHESRKDQEFLEKQQPEIEKLIMRGKILRQNLVRELELGYSSYEHLSNTKIDGWEKQIASMQLQLEDKEEKKELLVNRLNESFYSNRGYLLDYQLNYAYAFEKDYKEEFPEITPARIELNARYRGEQVGIGKLAKLLKEEIEEIRNLIKSNDKELFEDILANTIGRKIRNKINASMAWVEHMNHLMEAMNTSSGLKLSLKWKSKTAEIENQLDTKELVELLKKDARLMTEAEFDKLSVHFRSKVEQARRNTRESSQPLSFFAIMRETLDYRKWFEFELFFQKGEERKKELTNSCFGTFSGGEKAMSMYVPLFSAVVAKYQGGRDDAPRIVSLDEAFAGVDNRNIRDMFRLMSEFQFNFIINSQVLWGDSDTLDGLAIYQLHRLNNQKFVTVMSFIWNGSERKSVSEIVN